MEQYREASFINKWQVYISVIEWHRNIAVIDDQ